MLALSHGGRDTLDNTVPACGSCNASKSNGEVTRWLLRRHFDEQRFLLRHVEVAAALAVRFPDGPEGGPEHELEGEPDVPDVAEPRTS